MSDLFESSDSVRSAGELPYAKTITLEEPFDLALGGSLAEVTVCYETYGTLSPARDNAVLVCHAVSGDSHVAQHHADDSPGWWDIAIGPGKAIDTDKYFVICTNLLGGCRGTTGPNSISPATGKPYGADFPRITVADMVGLQRHVVDALGIETLLAVVGASLGGMQVLEWAAAYPDRVRGAIPIATSPRLGAQGLAFDIIGRNAIRKDPNFRGGQYYDDGPGPDDGLALARMIGHITYLSRDSMADKFDPQREQPREVGYAFETDYSVGSYLAYQGGRFVERFDANSYITLSMVMDQFNLTRDYGSLIAAMARARCRWLVISYSSDWLFPPAQSREIVDAIIATERPVSYCSVDSNCGHDAFLLEDSLDLYGRLIEAFLARTLNQEANGESAAPAEPPGGAVPGKGSIFHGRRVDYERIERLIPPGKGVLDLGCGDGELLARLKRRGERDLLGIELDPDAILAAVRRGVDVIQGDLDAGLGDFSDRQFDIVLLSQTLQSVANPETVLLEMLRVGRQCIVSFPNFAHKEARRQLNEEGVSPVTGPLPYKWYRSPNRHFLSIKDFHQFCEDFGITVHRMVALDSATGEEVQDDANLNADTAIFVISRPG